MFCRLAWCAVASSFSPINFLCYYGVRHTVLQPSPWIFATELSSLGVSSGDIKAILFCSLTVFVRVTVMVRSSPLCRLSFNTYSVHTTPNFGGLSLSALSKELNHFAFISTLILPQVSGVTLTVQQGIVERTTYCSTTLYHLIERQNSLCQL